MRKRLSIYLLFLLLSPALFAQSPASRDLFLQGERLRSEYEFDKAIASYRKALASSTDSLFIAQANRRIVLCENGKNLCRYVSRPKVLGRTRIPKKDFFLYYDLYPDAQWCYAPDTLITSLGGNPKSLSPILWRNGQKRFVFSVTDSLSGKSDLFLCRLLADSLWSAPERMGPEINSPENETCPMLSPDETVLFFSSDGHYGMGDYNLYKSVWDERTQTWSVAENMGIPFSSPANDLLLALSRNMESLYFVSSRGGISPDSLYLYHVEYESLSLKTEVRDSKEIRSLAQLRPSAAGEAVENRTRDTVPPFQDERYGRAAKAIGTLKARIAAQENTLQKQREQYQALKEEADKAALAKSIEKGEASLMALHEQWKAKEKEVQALEMELLNRGIFVPEDLENPKEDEAPGQAARPFRPVKQPLTVLRGVYFEKPAPLIPPLNLNFRKDPTSAVLTLDSVPSDKIGNRLVYRIQLFTLMRKAGDRQLKGFRPVFEIKTGKSYIYQAGWFATYAQASQALSTLKKAGFSGAVITAYSDGKKISLSAARKQEASPTPQNYRVYIGCFPQGIPADFRNLIKTLSAKEIVRTEVEGEIRYYMGPFDSKEQAQDLARSLQKAGYENVSLEKNE